jgi:hypothetical protein
MLQICHLKIPRPSSFRIGKVVLKIQNGEIAHPTCERLITGSLTEHSGAHQRQSRATFDSHDRFASVAQHIVKQQSGQQMIARVPCRGSGGPLIRELLLNRIK